MTSFRVKLIGFGLTLLHFLPGYFPVFPSSFIHRETGGGMLGLGLQNMKEKRYREDNPSQKDGE